MSKVNQAIAGLAVLAAVAALAACGGSNGGSGSSSSASSGNASASSCGGVPTQKPADPDGVLANFSPEVQKAFNLYPAPVLRSTWADWKPKGQGPYTVAIAVSETQAPYTATLLQTLQGLQTRDSGLVKELKVLIANRSAQTQVQQLQQAVRDGVDLLIVYPTSLEADAPVFDEARTAGIPVITPLSPPTGPHVIGMDGNYVLRGASLMSALVDIMGGKGSLLEMQAVPGLIANDDYLKGADGVLRNCPDIKVVGKPLGQFTPAVAKTQTLQFLAAHPQPIDAALQLGGMATGMIQAFQQTGRKVPAFADQGATPGLLAYWNQHRGDYKAVSTPNPPIQAAEATWNIATGLLQGRGIKVNSVLEEPVLITDKNLDQWVKPEWTVDTPLSNAPAPAGTFYAPDYLNQFFTRPAK